MLTLFNKTYELSLTRNYVSRWGMVEAVRELIQNAIDSPSPFVYEISGADNEFSLSLNSEFTTLLPSTLLLGATSKAEDPDSIGSFGEGYKLALLVLTRLGHDVEMRNGHLLWKPRFRFSKTFGEELLVIDETELPDKTNKGLTFVVHGLSEDDIKLIRGSCLHMQDGIGQIKRVTKGDILLTEQLGKLFVGGLYVCDTELHYGYNIKPQFLKLERDRQTVSTWDLAWLAKDMWFETGEFDRIAEMIKANLADMQSAEYGAPEMVKEACYKLFKSNHPKSVVAKNQEQLEQMVKTGMEKVVVLSSTYYHTVSGAKSYKEEAPQIRIVPPIEILETWFAKAKYDMADKHKATFKQLLVEAKDWRAS